MSNSLPSNNNNGKQPQPRSSPRLEATIDDLPDELLGLIFRQLWPPWLHRVRVEGVSKRFQRVALAHGWADISEFTVTEVSGNGLYDHPSWWGPLLSRVGPHLSALELRGKFARHNSAEALRVELEKCPRLKHLSVCWQLLDPPTALEHIGRAYATTLKSLRLSNWGCSKVEAVRDLNKALSNLSALECLDVRECDVEVFIREFKLSAASLPNLRNLTFGTNWGRILSEANIEVLAALPRLRSFTLIHFVPLLDFSFLKRFPCLEHLNMWGITDDNVESFIEALPHLGQTLKALGLYKTIYSAPASIPLFERLSAAVTQHLPLLEHLDLWISFAEGVDGAEVHPRLQQHLFNPLGFSPPLRNLRSLTLFGNIEPLSWAWLEAMSHRLEFLELGKTLPLSTLCSIVGNAKALRELNLGITTLSATVRKLLVEASFGRESTSDGEKGAKLPKVNCPILRIGFYGAYEERNKHENNARVQFCPRQDLHSSVHSHVLDFYRYGCLSEGPPSFIRD